MKTRWQDWVNLIVGIWLFISPWIFNYSGAGHAWNSFLFGGAIAIFSLWALVDRKIWEEWINLVIGIWIFISPWILGFASSRTLLWNMLIVGAIVSVLSVWDVSVYRKPAATA